MNLCTRSQSFTTENCIYNVAKNLFEICKGYESWFGNWIYCKFESRNCSVNMK